MRRTRWRPQAGLLVKPTDRTLTYVSAINARGQITADGEQGNLTHVYLLTSVLEELDEGEAPDK